MDDRGPAHEGTARRPNRYDQLIQVIFSRHYAAGDEEVEFARDEFAEVAL